MRKQKIKKIIDLLLVLQYYSKRQSSGNFCAKSKLLLNIVIAITITFCVQQKLQLHLTLHSHNTASQPQASESSVGKARKTRRDKGEGKTDYHKLLSGYTPADDSMDISESANEQSISSERVHGNRRLLESSVWARQIATINGNPASGLKLDEAAVCITPLSTDELVTWGAVKKNGDSKSSDCNETINENVDIVAEESVQATQPCINSHMERLSLVNISGKEIHDKIQSNNSSNVHFATDAMTVNEVRSDLIDNPTQRTFLFDAPSLSECRPSSSSSSILLTVTNSINR